MSPSVWIGSAGFGQGDSILVRRLLYAAFFLEVGLLLIVLPWSAFWERNYFASLWPLARSFVSNNFVRGAVTGLGVVNLVMGFAELVPIFAARDRPDGEIAGRGRGDAPSFPAHPDAQVDP